MSVGPIPGLRCASDRAAPDERAHCVPFADGNHRRIRHRGLPARARGFAGPARASRPPPRTTALRPWPRLLRERTGEILAANRADLERGREAGLDDALIDRLSLDAERVEAMAVGVEAVRRARPIRSAS